MTFVGTLDVILKSLILGAAKQSNCSVVYNGKHPNDV